jgi:hypothetical protein
VLDFCKLLVQQGKRGMKGTVWITFASLISGVAYAADGYPVDGAWAAVIENSAGTEIEACEAFRKFGARNLSGNAVGEIVVFSGKKRLDFGGYADTESTNISVEAKPNGQFRIVDQYYNDGEGGGHPGLKKKIYLLKFVDAATLEISEGRHASRYVKCMSKKLEPVSGTATRAHETSEPTATLIELWYDANSRCRGGPGDSALTDAACSERDRYTSRLDALDRCYGKRGQIGAEMKWHVCASDSLRGTRLHN